uniref:Beta-mannosidase-like galactose-binding domain-containing protein n=1 Tax=Phlebotomus papatasi TaxID=29031 RepID=A0A1B0EZX9_PHLPP
MSCLWWSFGIMSSATTIGFLVLYLVAFTTSSQIVLNSGWSLSNANATIGLTELSLPSGVYTALQNAGLTGSVLHSYNDVNLRWIALDNWTYFLNFSG